MSELAFPPGLVLVLGAFLLPLLKQPVRQFVALGLPLLALALVWIQPLGNLISLPFLQYTLEPLTITETGRVFATIFSIMAFVGTLYALPTARTVELSAAFAYAGSAIGVTCSGDLISVFIFCPRTL